MKTYTIHNTTPKCLCCKKELIQDNVFDGHPGWAGGNILFQLWNGIVFHIEAKYGSTHDGEKIISAICDDCIDEKIKEGLILEAGD